MGLLNYLFSGPKLRSKILSKIIDTEQAIVINERLRKYNIEKKSIRAAEKLKRKIDHQEDIVKILKELL